MTDTEAKAPTPRQLIRHFIACKAGIHVPAKGTGAGIYEPCAFETKRYPKLRAAEIEFEKHGLTHGRAGQKKIVVERREVEVAL